MDRKEKLKEKFKQALISTVKVISEDYKPDIYKNNASSKDFNFFELDNLNSKNDFIRLRAEADSEALKKKFSNKEIYQKNLPNNSSYRSLYDISEKIRYEILGSKMLKGISKNFNENYNQKLTLKRKDQLKNKDDVNVIEAFELYMLKNFFNIKLNIFSSKILSFWEKDFNSYMSNHIKFLHKNIENQEAYNSKFSEIFGKMDFFDHENEHEKNETQDNQENSNNNDQNQSDEGQEKNEQEESRCGPPEEHSVRSIARVILHDILQTTRVSSKTYPSKQRIERKRFAKTLCRYLWNKGTESKNNADAPTRTPTQRLTSDYESSTVVLRVLRASGNHSDAGFAKKSTNDHKNFQIAPEKRFTTSSTHATSREKV